MTFLPADDAALLALFWPFQTGQLELDDSPVQFLGARPGPWTVSWRHLDWQCEQPHRAVYQALQAQRIAVTARISADDFPVTLVLPTRQREEARAMLAQAVASTREGGLVVAAAANAYRDYVPAEQPAREELNRLLREHDVILASYLAWMNRGDWQ